MNCDVCEKARDEGQTFCPSCGSSLQSDSVFFNSRVESSQPAPPSNASTESARGRSKIVPLSIVVVVIVAVCILAWQLLK